MSGYILCQVKRAKNPYYISNISHPVLHEQNFQHEELLACHPEQWAQLVKSIVV